MNHSPIILRQPGARHAVLLIHGILESPCQFADLARALSPMADVYCILLPGHGGSGRDFGESSMAQWRRAVRSALSDLSGQYEGILLGGHSMGALLAVEEAVQNPSGVRGLFLLAAPFCIRLKPVGAACAAKAALNIAGRDDPLASAARQSFSVGLASPLEILSWLPRYRELFALARESRKTVRRLTLPVLAFQSGRDEFVSPASSRYFAGMENIRCRSLPRSGHFLYDPREREAVLRNLVKFFRWLFPEGQDELPSPAGDSGDILETTRKQEDESSNSCILI